MKLYRTLDEVYDGKPLISEGSQFRCPVCDKVYKREASAQAHLSARGCHSLMDLVMDCPIEKRMFDFYVALMSNIGGRHRVSLATFRKNTTAYLKIFNFLSFCISHEVDYYQYAEYLLAKRPDVVAYQALAGGAYDKPLAEYRDFLRKEPDLIDSESYFDRYKDELQSDMSFCLRALEKAKVSLPYLLSKIDTDALIEHSTQVEQLRFHEFLDKYA